MGDRRAKSAPARRLLAAALTSAALALGAGHALASQSIDDLNSQIAGAKDQAQALGAQINQASAALAGGQQRAMIAAQREAQLSAVLQAGQEREARLEEQVSLTQGQLKEARTQLQRGLNALSSRLVAIYRGGMPDTATVLLESDG